MSVNLKLDRLVLKSLLLPICFAGGGALAQSQVWEKLVTPGLVYRMEIDMQLPRVIHAYRYFPGSANVTSQPELARPTVFETDRDLNGRSTLTQTIKRTGAIAGINGDFFPWTGDPIGAMVRQGELISTPYGNRPVFAWGAGYADVGRMTFSGSVSQGGIELEVTGINEMCDTDMLILSTPTAGFAKANQAVVHVIIETDKAVTPSREITGRIKLIVPDTRTMKVEPGTLILTGTGRYLSQLAKLKRGEDIKITVKSGPFDWGKVSNVIAGGPTLVKNGMISLSASAEGFSASFSDTKHPRSAIGRTALGDLWMVVVDGRQAISGGCSLQELAGIMQRLGCVDAMNLDGGGSSTLALGEMVLNRPSGGSERPISNSILFFQQKPIASEVQSYVIKGKPKLIQGEKLVYTVVNGSGEIVPNSSVIWSSHGGAAWVDQGGMVRTLAPGTCRLSAWIHGQVVSVDVLVEQP